MNSSEFAAFTPPENEYVDYEGAWPDELEALDAWGSVGDDDDD